MTISSADPPLESQSGEFPTFDKVVTVSNCYYYLSLLERFVETTKDMSESVLKLYLVRAEYRYYKWAYSREADFGSMKNAIPPLGNIDSAPTLHSALLTYTVLKMLPSFGKLTC